MSDPAENDIGPVQEDVVSSSNGAAEAASNNRRPRRPGQPPSPVQEHHVSTTGLIPNDPDDYDEFIYSDGSEDEVVQSNVITSTGTSEEAPESSESSSEAIDSEDDSDFAFGYLEPIEERVMEFLENEQL